MQRAINQRSAKHLPFEAFLDLAAATNCVGVEPRNDLGRPLFDGIAPSVAAELAKQRGLRILALGEIYPFNNWNRERETQVRVLLDAAIESGAESIILIPEVNLAQTHTRQLTAATVSAMDAIAYMLEGTGVTGLIEPIGFNSSSIRTQADVVPLMTALGKDNPFKLIHDTFQHFISGDNDYFAEHIATVQISGVSDPTVVLDESQDGHRVYVEAEDRCENIAQLKALFSRGFDGPVSFETTEVALLDAPDLEAQMRKSFEYIERRLAE